MAFEPASYNVSTSPMRTRVENSEPSRTTDSAAVAPAFMAAATTSVAVCFKFIFAFHRGGTEARRNSFHQTQNLDPSTPLRCAPFLQRLKPLTFKTLCQR